MKRVFALYLLMCVANAQSEPEPEEYTTTQAPQPEHKIAMAVKMSFGAITNTAALLDKIKAGVTKGVNNADVTVKVEVKAVHLKATYTNLPDPLPTTTRDDIAHATYKMYDGGVPIGNIRVNNYTHSNPSSVTRRLQNTGTAEVVAIVNNDNSGLVSKVKNLQTKSSAANLLTELKTINSATYDSYSITGGTPELEVVAETTVTGTNTAPSTSALVTNVAAETGGTVQITSVTSSNVVTTSVMNYESDDHAPIAPMITIWAALYAFVMS